MLRPQQASQNVLQFYSREDKDGLVFDILFVQVVNYLIEQFKTCNTIYRVSDSSCHPLKKTESQSWGEFLDSVFFLHPMFFFLHPMSGTLFF